MRSLLNQVPRLQGLAVFEAAARLGSFTAAATELGMSQPAVSKHIAIIEDQLKTVLFDRGGNRRELTADGRELFAGVDRGFSEIEDGLGRMRSGLDVLTVAMQPVVAETWFSPHLQELRNVLAPTRLHVVIYDHDSELASMEHDVSVRFGTGRVPGLRSELLVPEVAVPAASPDYADRHGLASESPARALLHADLVDFDQTGRSWIDWVQWFAAHDITPPQIDQVVYRTYGSTVPVALGGAGVILTWRHLRGDLVERGLLVEVGPAVENQANGYHLVWPAALSRDEGLRRLRTWIRATADRHR
jgi:DNA-binding transcriptional LysR family regulator